MIKSILIPWVISIILFIISYGIYFILNKEITKRIAKREKEVIESSKIAISGTLEKEIHDSNEVIKTSEFLDKYNKRKKIEINIYLILFITDLVIVLSTMILYLLFSNNIFEYTYKIYSSSVLLLPLIGINLISDLKFKSSKQMLN